MGHGDVMIEAQRGCAELGLYLVPTTEGNRGFNEKLGFEVLGTEIRRTLS